jgi:hypothetical protein
MPAVFFEKITENYKPLVLQAFQRYVKNEYADIFVKTFDFIA